MIFIVSYSYNKYYISGRTFCYWPFCMHSDIVIVIGIGIFVIIFFMTWQFYCTFSKILEFYLYSSTYKFSKYGEFYCIFFKHEEFWCTSSKYITYIHLWEFYRIFSKIWEFYCKCSKIWKFYCVFYQIWNFTVYSPLYESSTVYPPSMRILQYIL